MLQTLSMFVGLLALFLLIVIVVVGLSIERERARRHTDLNYVPLQRTLDQPEE